MNKNAIQKYAIWARNELIEQVKQRAYQYGITDKGYGDENAAVIAGRVLSKEEKQQRYSFVVEIKKNGYQQAVEEVAYTWFNRFVALRYMEVNDYLPTHVRVFSDAGGNFNPEILNDVLHLDLEGLDKAKVSEQLNANKTEELYRYLLLTQCNALNSALPEMFERLGSYTEMLLPNNILKPEGVLGRLVADIPEEDFRDAVQIIGWMYQYYNTEPKQAVFDGLKKNVKISKEKIPAATQLFTPDWIVRYMVENSLGRLWLESHPNAALKANWKYYLDEAEQTPEVAKKLHVMRSQSPVKSPEDIRLIDPCMGSGHILVYAFDVLMQIYESEGYNPRDAAKLILEKNIYGLDIDDRAYQLAYFSLMMKARQYDRRLFSRGIKPHVCAIQESNGITTAPMHDMGLHLTDEEYGEAVKHAMRLVDEFHDAKEYGSILNITPCDWDLLRRFAVPRDEYDQLKLDIHGEKEAAKRLQKLVEIGETMAQKYDVVVTNPPYMGSSGMSAKMSEFVKNNYPDSKSDLFAVFIEKCGELLKPTGYQAMITQHAWMFLSSFEKLRGKMLQRDIVNMAHLGARAFEEIGGEVVQTTAFVLSKRNTADFEATYVRLVDYNSQQAKEIAFLSVNDRYTAKKESFKKIPGSPVAYWVSESVLKAYRNKCLIDISKPCKGIDTGDNAVFLRFWFEVANTTFISPELGKRKWIPYNKGGSYRKWYGNNEYVLDWSNDGATLRNFKGSNLRNKNYYFREGITWSTVTSGKPSFRKFGNGFTFDNGGCCLFTREKLLYIQALLNSSVTLHLMGIAPTLNFQPGDIGRVPVIIDNTADVEEIVRTNIALSRADWDAFETSWDFRKHPLL